MAAPRARTPRFPAETRAGDNAQPTRQQLDDLDALLQRMLALPVNQAENEPAAPAPAPRQAEERPAPAPAAEPRPVTAALRAEQMLAQALSEERPRVVPAAPATPPSKRPPVGDKPKTGRSYPPSYMVVESVAPLPAPAPVDESPRPAVELGPRLLGHPEPADSVPEMLLPSGHGSPLPEVPAPAAPAEQDGGDWMPLRSSWQPSPHTWGPLADNWQQVRAAALAPAAPAAPAAAPAPPEPEWAPATPAAPQPVIPPAPTQREPISEPPVAPPQEEQAPGLLLPLVWFNRAFDLLLFPLGPLGGWLRGRSGRNFLGTVGLACLLAALALAVADGIGWTW